MARLPRLTLPDYPHHIIQRGNNRQAIFTCDAERELLLGLLTQACLSTDVALHAYVLMDNHFHLLVTPSDTEGVPKLMQSIGRKYVRTFNQRHARTGTLWEGRYRSTLIQTESYLLTCMAYLDLNPVRAGMVQDARDHRWSSYSHYAGLMPQPWLTPHPIYWELGNTPFEREAAYEAMVRAGLSQANTSALTHATLSGWALGNEAFQAQLRERAGRRVAPAKAGRPQAQKPKP